MKLSDQHARALAEILCDSVTDGIVVVDAGYRVLSVNQTFCELFPIHATEAEGRLVFELGAGQWDRADLRRALESAAQFRAPITELELHFVKRDAAKKTVRCTVRPVAGPVGNLECMTLIFTDVTALREARRKAAECEIKYQTFVEELNSIIISIDRNGRIAFFNRFSEKLFGYSREEIIGNYLVDAIIPRIDSAGRDNARLVERIFSSPESYYMAESEGVRKDNTRIWFQWSARALADQTGALTHVLIDGNDLSPVREARRERDEKSATLDALLDFIPEGILIADENHEIQSVSRAMGELLGIAPEQMIHATEAGRLSTLPFFGPDGKRITRPGDFPLAKAADTGQRFDNFEMVLKRNGFSKYLSVNAAPIRNAQGAVAGAIGGWRDITEQRTHMAEIQRRQRVLDAIMRYIPIGLMLIDKNGRITAASAHQSELLGIPADELIGACVHPGRWGLQAKLSAESVKIENMPSSRAMRERTVIEDQFVLRRNEFLRAVALRAGPVLDDSGRATGCVTVWRDITERERALAQFDATVKAAPDGLVIYQPNGDIRLINDTAKTILGYRDDDVRRSLERRMRAITLSTADGIILDLEQYPFMRALRGEIVRGLVLKIELRGRSRWLSFGAAPIKTAGNMIDGAIMTFADITDTINLQHSLEQSVQRFRSMFEFHRAVMLLIDPGDGHIEDANRAAAEFYGYSRETLRRMHIQEINQLSPDQIHQEMENTRTEKRPYHVFQHRLAHRGVRWVEVYSSPIRIQNKQLLFSIIHDVTERKRAEQDLQRSTEELAAANRDLESFSYSVSHDLRGPLHVVKSLVEIIGEGSSARLDTNSRECLEHIDQSVVKMQRIIDSLLSLSRIGRQQIHREPVDLSALVRAYLEELHRNEPSRTAEFTIQEQVSALVDPRLFPLAVENLLRNAWKFTARETITRITFGSLERNGRRIMYLRDNGAGFSQENADILFKPFSRLHADKEYAGTGIGLSIVERIINRHGGAIWAEGAPGEGAVFYFTIPGCSNSPRQNSTV